jgi:hypothetical protein
VAYILLYGFFSYIVPLLLIIYFYTKIILIFKESTKTMIALQEINAYKFDMQKSERMSNLLSLDRQPSATLSMIVLSGNKMILKRVKQERNLMMSVARLIASWFIAWTPYAVISVIGLFAPHLIIHPAVSMFPALFAKVSSVINPYIYFLSSPRLRREFVQLSGKGSNWMRSKVQNFDQSFSRIATILTRTIVRTDNASQVRTDSV